MLKVSKTLVLCIFSFSLFNLTLYSAKAQDNNNEKLNAITTAVPFLLIAPDTRAGAMGDAGVSTTPDANSVYWNPSKLAFIEKDMGFSLSYIPWLRALVPDINLSYVSGFKRLDKDQTIAASLFYSSLGQISFTAEDGTSLGDYRPNEFALNVAYSRKLSDQFSGGLAAKYIYSNLTMGQMVGGAQTKPGQSFAMDVSMYYRNTNIDIGKTAAVFAFGINASNIGSKMSYSNAGIRNFIPINLRLGPSLTLKPDDYNSIAFTVDAMKLMVPTPPARDLNNQIVAGENPDVGIAKGIFQSFYDAPGVIETDGSRSVLKEELREVNLGFGTEYWYDKQFALRCGYFHEHATKGNRKFLTFGAGLKYNVFGLDLAYLVATQQRNPLGNTFRFTLTFDFDAFKSQSN
jgi:hypothetical protein